MMDILQPLKQPSRESRLAALEAQCKRNGGLMHHRPLTEEVNNHVHTIYSFSPYSPTEVAAAARYAGLRAVGSIDHDSIAAADELHSAARIIGIGATSGFELRVSWRNTPYNDARLNSPDACGVSYVVVHAVPARSRAAADSLLGPIREARRRRNARQVAGLNAVIGRIGIRPLSNAEDVEPLSRVAEGGTVTERHILFALAERLTREIGRGRRLIRELQRAFGLELSETQTAQLSDPESPHYLYDLLGALKAELLPRFYLEPGPDECVLLESVIEHAHRLEAVMAYPYLGDVTDSPTGDKKAAEFEDAYLGELIPYLKSAGFHAVTYMPPRNTREQLLCVQRLCRGHELMEISGVDINSSRQSFTCAEVLEPEFRHLIDSAWALIAHEELAEKDPTLGLFHPRSPLRTEGVENRIAAYARLGRALDLRRPQDCAMDEAALMRCRSETGGGLK